MTQLTWKRENIEIGICDFGQGAVGLGAAQPALSAHSRILLL